MYRSLSLASCTTCRSCRNVENVGSRCFSRKIQNQPVETCILRVLWSQVAANPISAEMTGPTPPEPDAFPSTTTRQLRNAGIRDNRPSIDSTHLYTSCPSRSVTLPQPTLDQCSKVCEASYLLQELSVDPLDLYPAPYRSHATLPVQHRK
jgi:hypothetical protein